MKPTLNQEEEKIEFINVFRVKFVLEQVKLSRIFHIR